MIFPGFPGVLSFFQVFQVEWKPCLWIFHQCLRLCRHQIACCVLYRRHSPDPDTQFAVLSHTFRILTHTIVNCVQWDQWRRHKTHEQIFGDHVAERTRLVYMITRKIYTETQIMLPIYIWIHSTIVIIYDLQECIILGSGSSYDPPLTFVCCFAALGSESLQVGNG